MSRPLNVLAVAGFRINIGDDSPYWDLIEAVDELPNTEVTMREWETMKDEDIVGRDAVLCYSWGCATVFKAFERLKKAGKLTKLPILIIIAGVPRGVGQWLSVKLSGGWKVPEEVTVAVCIQVDSFPVSYPIVNSGPMRVNVLVTGIPGNDHVGIQDYADAHDLVLTTLGAAAEAIM